MSRQDRRDFPWGAMCILAIFALLAISGCGTQREEAQHREEHAQKAQVEHVRTERNAFAPDGTPYVESTVTTRTLEETSQIDANTRIDSTTTLQVPALSAAVTIAAGAAGGTPWGALIGTVTTAAAAMWAAHQNARATAERKRGDEQKADADEGWRKADERALALPPGFKP